MRGNKLLMLYSNVPIFKLVNRRVSVSGAELGHFTARGVARNSFNTGVVVRAKNISGFADLLEEADVKAELNYDKEFIAGMQMLYAKFGCETPVSDKKLTRLLDIVDFCNR